jgi:hypothetical protein
VGHIHSIQLCSGSSIALSLMSLQCLGEFCRQAETVWDLSRFGSSWLVSSTGAWALKVWGSVAWLGSYDSFAFPLERDAVPAAHSRVIYSSQMCCPTGSFPASRSSLF